MRCSFVLRENKISFSNWCNKEGGRDHPLGGMCNSLEFLSSLSCTAFFFPNDLIIFALCDVESTLPRVSKWKSKSSFSFFFFFHLCWNDSILVDCCACVRLTDSNLLWFPVNTSRGESILSPCKKREVCTQRRKIIRTNTTRLSLSLSSGFCRGSATTSL